MGEYESAITQKVSERAYAQRLSDVWYEWRQDIRDTSNVNSILCDRGALRVEARKVLS